MGNCLERVLNLFKQAKTHRISGRRLKQIKLIAQGGYGYVYLVQDVQSNKNYAMKKIICQSEDQRQNYQREVQMIKQMSHCSYVIGYFGSHQIQRNDYLEAYILMQLADKTVLDLVLEARQKQTVIPESQRVRILLETAKGLKQMHSLGIIHKDIKIENILICQSGRAKICDFGSCGKQKIQVKKLNKAQRYKYQEQFQKNTTLMYRPPQMIDLFQQYTIDQKVDLWMLGCVLFVMNYNFHPFQEQGKLSIVNASIKYPKKDVSQKMQDLTRHLLTPNPYFRPGVDQIIEILQKWHQVPQIVLNPVAKVIKQNQELMQSGQYDKASKNDWRNIKITKQQIEEENKQKRNKR